MTQAHKTIESEFRKYPNNERPEWKSVCDNVIAAYRWEDEYILFNKFYIEKKSRIAVCMEIGISENTFTNWKRAILENAYKWAISYGLL